MDRSRWISLAIVLLYVAVYALTLVWADDPAGQSATERFEEERAGFVLLFLGFVCIWWGEFLGPGSVGMQCALVSEPTSPATMEALGWIFMVLAVVVPIADFLCGD
jgi:hypothetical protein